MERAYSHTIAPTQTGASTIIAPPLKNNHPAEFISQTKNNSHQSAQLLSGIAAKLACLPMLPSNWIEAARATPRGRNKFSSWPGCVACAVVLVCDSPLTHLLSTAGFWLYTVNLAQLAGLERVTF
jgi:hypothetical protein